MQELLAVRNNLAPAGLSLLLGLALLIGVDLGAGRAHLDAAQPLSAPLFQGFEGLDREVGSRVAGPGSELRLSGFPPGADVSLELRLSTARRRPFEAAVWVNGALAGRGRVRGVPESMRAEGRADERGELRLRFGGAEREAAVHFYALDASWRPRPWRLPRAVLALLAPLVALGLLGAWCGARAGGASACVLGASAALALALSQARLTLLAQAGCLAACALAGLALALVCSALGLARSWTRWYVAAGILRLGLVAQADFPCIDCLSHHQGYLRFSRGQLNTGTAPGPRPGGLAVPYPPGVYAALQPVYALTGPRVGTRVVRYGILALEALAPLLLAGVLCAGGAPRRAAAAAAAVLAALPEGLLVSAKGIAANAFGAELTIVALWALARPSSSLATLAALFALGLLSHVGAAITLLAAALLFLLRRSAHDARLLRRGCVALALAAAVAWWAYYREVWSVSQSAAQAVRASGATFGSEGWAPRWFRAGKTLQDLVLKFGAAPLVLCWVGWRRGLLPERLHQLSTSCLAVAGLTGLAACLTPYPLRFEYFALPAVALLAGGAAETWERTGRAGLAQAAIAVALCVQAAVGVGLLQGWLDPIDVILESPRWPARDRLLAALLG